jgi:CheY-like chemotaxis protein
MEAANGEDALAILRAGAQPDVILLDLKMPTMTGVEFRAHQLAEPRFAMVPIIVISAIAHPRLDWRGQPPAVLRKPFRLDELVTAIDHVTRKQSGLHVRPGRRHSRKVGEA